MTTTPSAEHRGNTTRCRGFHFPFFFPACRSCGLFFFFHSRRRRRRRASSAAADRAVAGRMDRRIAQRSPGIGKKNPGWNGGRGMGGWELVAEGEGANGERAPCRERRVRARRLSEKPVLNLRKPGAHPLANSRYNIPPTCTMALSVQSQSPSAGCSSLCR